MIFHFSDGSLYSFAQEMQEIWNRNVLSLFIFYSFITISGIQTNKQHTVYQCKRKIGKP